MIKQIAIFIFSAFIATIFWLALVSTGQNIKVYENPVTVKYFNVPEGLSIISKEISVQLKIDTAENTKNLSPDTFQAFVDLSEAKTKELNLPIQVKSNNPRIRIVSYEPKSADIAMEDIEERLFNVNLETRGKIDDNYEIESSKLSKDKIKLKGGKSVLDRVSKLLAILQLNSENTDFNKNATLKAYDSENNEVNNISYEQETVEVEVRLDRQVYEKTVGIKLPITGNIANENSYLKSIKISPQFTEISGPKFSVELYENINTEELDLSEITKSTSIYKRILAPNYTQITGIKQVKVDIEIEQLIEPKN